MKISSLLELPKLIENTLKIERDIQEASKDFSKAKGSMFLGRGYSFPIALEGALKLKELAYVHAEGYPAADTIAIIATTTRISKRVNPLMF